MKSREFSFETDYEEVEQWFVARKWAMQPALLSDMGRVVSDDKGLIAAGWLYLTNSTWSFIEHLVTNPNAGLKARHKAIRLILDELTGLAFKNHATNCVGFLKSRGIVKAYRRAGFQVTDQGMTVVMKVKDGGI